MSGLKIGREHKSRKALFTRGIRRGFLTLTEIDGALPPETMTDAERWLLFYSLHAARVEILDADGERIGLDQLRPGHDELQETADSDEQHPEGQHSDQQH